MKSHKNQQVLLLLRAAKDSMGFCQVANQDLRGTQAGTVPLPDPIPWKSASTIH